MKARPLAAAITVVAALLAAPAGTTAASAATSASVPASNQLAGAGRWITDAAGRVVIVHGVNMPSKTTPATPQSLNFGDDDAALLNRLGINAVRLTVERYAVEPHPGQFDAGYVAQFAAAMQMLAQHGIDTLIDFHQDDFGPVFFDNGYPDWMTVTDGLPNLFFSPYPTGYFDNPAENRAYDHVWANDLDTTGNNHLQDDDAGILGYVAAQLRNQPGLLGYEIMNEPWPGTAYPQCVNPVTGCPAFDQGEFSAYYQHVAPAIRAADPKHIVWYEPLVTFNQGVPTFVTPPSVSNRGFAFHDYSPCGDAQSFPIVGLSPGPQCDSMDQKVLSNALAFSQSSGDPLLETEFGATMDTTTIARELGDYDQAMMPWLWWSYTRYVVALDANNALTPATDNDVNWALADTLARPYPQLVSGTPTGWSYDPSAKVFHLSYSTQRASGGSSFGAGALTDVAVPSVTFPKGYSVSVQGGTVASAAGAPVLVIASCAGAATVTVTVSAAPATQPSSCSSVAAAATGAATVTGLPMTSSPASDVAPAALAAVGGVVAIGGRRRRSAAR